MGEMLDDTMDSLDDNEDELEDEAQEEVDKVLFQITDGKLGVVTGAVGTLPVRSRPRRFFYIVLILSISNKRRDLHSKRYRRTKRWSARSQGCSVREGGARSSFSRIPPEEIVRVTVLQCLY